MLQQRIITGVLLAIFFLVVVFLLPLSWMACVFAGVAVLGVWEWAGLSGIKVPWVRWLYAAALIPGLGALWLLCDLGGQSSRVQVQPWLGLACVFWSLALFLIKYYPSSAELWRFDVLRVLMGWLILGATWLALVFLRTMPNGGLLVLLLLILVAAADIGAYFIGRRFGVHKLVPAVSPGKTWEGLWGGVLAVFVITVIVFQNLPPTLAHLRMASVLLLAFAVAGASVVGDLTVSMLKREAGVKDTSHLLPGHGGVMDRIDSICGAAPIFALGLILMSY